MPSVNSSGSSPVLAATKTLTDAQVKALPTTAVQIVVAPGAGFALLPLHAVLRLSWAADYTNINVACQLAIETGTGASLGKLNEVRTDVSQLLASGASAAGWLPASGVVSVDPFALGSAGFLDGDWGNLPLSLVADNAAAGNFTGGNVANALKVTILYYVVTF